jgi:hypothetical protein
VLEAMARSASRPVDDGGSGGQEVAEAQPRHELASALGCRLIDRGWVVLTMVGRLLWWKGVEG